MYVAGFAPAPPTQLRIRVVLFHTKGVAERLSKRSVHYLCVINNNNKTHQLLLGLPPPLLPIHILLLPVPLSVQLPPNLPHLVESHLELQQVYYIT